MNKYIHIKTGNKYDLLKTVTNKSIPIDSIMVLYCQEDNYNKLYVINLSEFNEKFKKLSTNQQILKNENSKQKGERHRMDFNEYQNLTEKTDLKTGIEEGLNPPWLYYALGLSGETGELIDKFKKVFRDNKGVITEETRDNIIKEFGDILWYLSRLTAAFDISFNDVAQINIDKLFKRKKEGTLRGSGDNR